MWQFDGKALRALRKQRGWTAEQLSERAGIAARLVSRYETGTSLASDASAKSLAKVLDVKLETLAKRVVRPAPEPVRAAAPVAVQAASPAVAVPPPPSLSRLELLAALEQAGRCAIGEGDPPMITATTFQSVMSAYGLHGGRRFRVEGRVLLQRGLTPPEWKALGVKRGFSARFSVVREIVGSHELAVTVYARDAAHIRTLQEAFEANDGRATMTVHVFLTTDPSEFEGVPALGFRVFGSEVIHGWCFVVDAVQRSAPHGKKKGKR